MLVEVSGPAPPDDVWRSFIDPECWPTWAPQIRAVETAQRALRQGATGRILGPAPLAVDYEITAVDPALRTWSWTVRTGPVRLTMHHVVLPTPSGGTRALLRIHGGAAVAAQAYRPIAAMALRRLVEARAEHTEHTHDQLEPVEVFEFAFSPRYAAAARPFAITPRTASVELGPDWLYVRYGPWKLLTPRTNVAAAHLAGGFSFIKTAGPPHLSLSDRGISMTTNGERAICLEFAEPVSAIDTTGTIRHPGATLSVADPEALATALGLPLQT